MAFDKIQPEDLRDCDAYAEQLTARRAVTVQTVFGPITYIPRYEEPREFTIAEERALKNRLFGLNSNE
jgi:hypothetical protein